MYKWLVIIACVLIFAGCKKTNDVAVNINKQASIDDQAIAAYIQANNLTAVHVGAPKVDTIGVWYIVEDAGTEPALYTSSTSITVGYTAKTLTGAVVTNTGTGENDLHPSFVLGETIKGWQLGIQAAKINKGGKLRILMASRYAYPYGLTQYNLPANTPLDFEIQIFDVIN